MRLHTASIDECYSLIKSTGDIASYVIQGHMGSGKTSIFYMLAESLPDYHSIYCDCTTKEVGDMFIPDINNVVSEDAEGGAIKVLDYLYSRELGLHHKTPVLINFDEIAKANRPVQNAVLRLLLEHKAGNRSLAPGSILFGTTNLGAEGVGDMMEAHARNRVTIVTMDKPDALTWIPWAINNQVNPIIIQWVKENPHCLDSFEDYENPNENEYIFHPLAMRDSFVTNRSLFKAGLILDRKDALSDNALTQALAGTLGGRAARDLNAFVHLHDKIPTLESLRTDPDNAIVPEEPAAVCMVVYRALSVIKDRAEVKNWLKYLNKLDTSAQGLYVNGVRESKYNTDKRAMVMGTSEFQDWAMDKHYLFGDDKEIV